MNPLLKRDFQIPFAAIRAEHIEAGVREALGQAEQDLKNLVGYVPIRNFENTLGALDELTEKLGRVVKVAYHLNSVNSTPEIREAFNAVVPEFSAFYAKLPLNDKLWQAIRSYADTSEAKALTGVYKRHLEKTLDDFVRNGANLPPKDKARVETIQTELSQLQTQFSEHVLDATNAYELIVVDEEQLNGLPDNAKKQARADAKSHGKEGWRFGLQAPSFLPFMKHVENRALRETLYRNYQNRASEGELNNKPLINKILALRQELAQLLGYETFADFRLERNMVGSGQAALDFEQTLFEKTLPYWQRDIDTLSDYAKTLGIEELEPWDIYFVSERYRSEHFDFDAERLRPYFPLNKVMNGLFELCQRLFGVTISEAENAQVWHEDVGFYTIHDEAGVHLASFYTDWFPRDSKRPGAWMNAFITGGPDDDGGFRPHLGLMCGNFTKPQDAKPALLTHDEVQTTFHEFGHLLHHSLSRVPLRERAGTSVAWDFVELPSQMMENWCWEREALDMFARHVDTDEKIPDELFEKLTKARVFMEANAQMRQLSFGTVDLRLHSAYSASDGDVIEYGNAVMEPFSIQPHFAHNNFLNAFSHIFAGGYAAGYYSYKWSEVLDADAFSRFKREGIFNREVGRAYVESILSRGDSEDPAKLFEEFMGRGPDPDALLRRNLAADIPVSS